MNNKNEKPGQPSTKPQSPASTTKSDQDSKQQGARSAQQPGNANVADQKNAKQR